MSDLGGLGSLALDNAGGSMDLSAKSGGTNNFGANNNNHVYGNSAASIDKTTMTILGIVAIAAALYFFGVK